MSHNLGGSKLYFLNFIALEHSEMSDNHPTTSCGASVGVYLPKTIFVKTTLNFYNGESGKSAKIEIRKSDIIPGPNPLKFDF